jgi:FkbM family methyltransferase
MRLSNQLRSITYSTLSICAIPIRYFGLSGNNFFRKLYKKVMPIIVPDSNKIIELNGYKLRVKVDHKVNAIGVAQLLAFSESYDPIATKVCKQLIKQGMVTIDIGANIGYYSLLMSKLVGGSNTVWAFEPESNNFKELENNIKLNNITNIKAMQIALGNYTGQAKLFISPISDGMHSLLTDRKAKCKVEQVIIFKLDDYFRHLTIDFMKIDTEGNDLAVMQGAKRLIADSPNIKIIFEFWLDGLQLLKLTTQELLDKVYGLGFKYIYLIDERKKVVELADAQKIIAYSKAHGEGCNLLCTKQVYNNHY